MNGAMLEHQSRGSEMVVRVSVEGVVEARRTVFVEVDGQEVARRSVGESDAEIATVGGFWEPGIHSIKVWIDCGDAEDTLLAESHVLVYRSVDARLPESSEEGYSRWRCPFEIEEGDGLVVAPHLPLLIVPFTTQPLPESCTKCRHLACKHPLRCI